MPSHIFTRLGIWEESIQSNIQSAENARCYTQAIGINEGYYEELHAIDYLVYAYLQKGDNTRAEEQYELVNKLRSFYPTTITAVIYPIAAIPSRLALENKNWERAAKLELQEMDLDWEQFPWQKAIHHFSKALGSANTKDFSLAEEQIIMLTKLHENLAAQNDRSKLIQVKQVEIQIKTAQAWLHFNKNDKENGLALMQEAVAMERKTSLHPVTPGDVLPAIELLGDMLLKMNRPKEALVAYQENQNKHPHRFNGIYGAALAAKQSGDQEKAIQYFKQLLELSKNTNSTRPEIEEAINFVQQS